MAELYKPKKPPELIGDTMTREADGECAPVFQLSPFHFHGAIHLAHQHQTMHDHRAGDPPQHAQYDPVAYQWGHLCRGSIENQVVNQVSSFESPFAGSKMLRRDLFTLHLMASFNHRDLPDIGPETDVRAAALAAVH